MIDICGPPYVLGYTVDSDIEMKARLKEPGVLD
jgi:hypothetical protein